MMMFISPGNGDDCCSLGDEDGDGCRLSLNLYTFDDDADDDEDVGSLALACIHLHPIASTQRAPVKAPLQVSLNSRPPLQVADIR